MNLVWWLIYLVSLLPLRLYYLFSDIAAWLLCNIFSYRKSVIYTNMARSFPELSYSEIKKEAKEYYRYMCDIMVESLWQISASAKQQCKMVDVEGVEILNEMVAKHEKVVLLMGHRGNWEMMGVFLGDPQYRSPDSFAHHPITVTYKVARGKLSNFLFEKIRMNEYKKFDNAGYIVGSKQFLRHVLKGTGKHTYIFIADQYPRLGGTPVKFLNQNTFFFDGAESIAAKLGMPVVYMDMVRVRRGRYKMTFTLITENAKMGPDGQPGAAHGGYVHGAVTLKYAQLLEENIRANKYNWLWSHKRWKRGFTAQDEMECSKILLSLLDGKQISEDEKN